MAETKKYYGRNAVYGSLAYDFNNPALYPEETVEEEARWHVEHQADNPIIEEEQAAVQAPRTRQAVSPVSVIGLILASVLIVMSLMAQIQLTAVSSEAVALSEKLEELETEQTRLRIAYESAFNLAEIEEYAINELGMQKPRSDQVYYIDSVTSDKAEVLSPAEQDGVLDRLSDFIASFGEYLG